MPARVDEYRQKHQAVVQYMDGHGLEAVILSRRCNFAWFTGGGQNHVSMAAELGVASLLVTREGTLGLTNSIEGPRMAEEELAALGIEVRAPLWYDAEAIAADWNKALAGRRAACDAGVPGMPETVKLLDKDFDALRWTLCAAEVARYRALGREVGECLENACRQAKPGMSEHALGGLITAALQPRGIRAPVILIAADERVKKYRHPIPTFRKFADYGMAVCCGERDGLIVSASRLFAFKPLDDDLARRHRAVCAVDAAMLAATRPDNPLGAVFAVAQWVYAKQGFADEWKLHHQGGLTGYVGREIRVTPGNPTRIAVNQAFAWNPSIAGTKSEDTIIVGPQSNEIISATGQWPTHNYEAEGRSWPRCDILVLK